MNEIETLELKSDDIDKVEAYIAKALKQINLIDIDKDQYPVIAEAIEEIVSTLTDFDALFDNAKDAFYDEIRGIEWHEANS